MVDSSLVLGPLHHVSISVADVEAAARMYESTLGWVRLVDLPMDTEQARKVGVLIGLPRLDSARGIMVHQPGSLVGMVELIELHVQARPGDPAPEIPLGPLVLSYRVADLDEAVSRMLEGGYELVGEPQEMEMGGRLRAATFRGAHAVLTELIEFLGG